MTPKLPARGAERWAEGAPRQAKIRMIGEIENLGRIADVLWRRYEIPLRMTSRCVEFRASSVLRPRFPNVPGAGILNAPD